MRYRLHLRVGSCRPDLVFTSAMTAVFVDGCFWHGCPHHYVPPRTRHEFWSDKLTKNTTRDRRQIRDLVDAGWTVIRLWECEVMDDPSKAANVIQAALEGEPHHANDDWHVVDTIERNGNLVLGLIDRYNPSRRAECTRPRILPRGEKAILP